VNTRRGLRGLPANARADGDDHEQHAEPDEHLPAVEVVQREVVALLEVVDLEGEAALAVERSKRVPDVSVVAGYRRFTDIESNAVVVGASIPLPFFDRNRGGIEGARSRLAKGQEGRRAAPAPGRGLGSSGSRSASRAPGRARWPP